MAYSELIKNFEKIRAYMRQFYVYGFKSRSEYDSKSARSYDDERRRLESWLGEYMHFTQTPEGKNVFLSVDTRVVKRNPLYKAWKAKSFTDGDITFHFAIFDILYTPEVQKTLTELVEEIDSRLDGAMTFDESTLRKKLKEYADLGIIRMEKSGRRVLYSRSESTDLSNLWDTIDFFSECAPCGVVGSFLRDKESGKESLFSFKHHYMTQAIDSDVLATLFDAMQKKAYVTVDNLSRRSGEVRTIEMVPLKIYISAQNGRQHLIAYYEKTGHLNSYRLDYLSNVRIGEPCVRFSELREDLRKAEAYMWGVNCRFEDYPTEHVEFEVYVGTEEHFIIQRLQREKRCGRVEKVDDNHYRYVAEVFNTEEMLPWIRTFICRITKLNFSNRTVENRFKADLLKMYEMYGMDGGEEHDIQ